MVVTFELSGQKFMGLNGGPAHKINPSISFFVVCDTREEVDEAWQQLCEGGSVLMPLDSYDWSERYGWVSDRYGVNWQLSFGKLEDVGQKFTPTLMFVGKQHGKAREAIDFYTSIFDQSEIMGILPYSEADPDVTGTVKHAQFKLNGDVFMAMDSSLEHNFQFSEGLSLVVECDTQEEIDRYWNALLQQGGREDKCGWLKDRFGVSWQIIPSILPKLMAEPERSPRVVEAFMKMGKFNIQQLMEA
jgi:predicted 3-demethylubiquinone-9 3-methyltransferase (glyoxalase superfamily)